MCPNRFEQFGTNCLHGETESEASLSDLDFIEYRRCSLVVSIVGNILYKKTNCYEDAGNMHPTRQ